MVLVDVRRRKQYKINIHMTKTINIHMTKMMSSEKYTLVGLMLASNGIIQSRHDKDSNAELLAQWRVADCQ